MTIIFLNINKFFYHSFIIRVTVVIKPPVHETKFVATGFTQEMSESSDSKYSSNSC